MKGNVVKGFSKLPESEKRRLVAALCADPHTAIREMDSFLFSDNRLRETFLDLSENTISSYHLPYGIAPNFVIDGTVYHVPMVTEESSVIAAAASSARFWADKGGYVTREVSTVKRGHVYFRWYGQDGFLQENWLELLQALTGRLRNCTDRMERRGGGLIRIELRDDTAQTEHLYRLQVDFDTVDSMGANFINTCLEELAQELNIFLNHGNTGPDRPCRVVMSILSNYYDGCYVTLEASCPVKLLKGIAGTFTVEEFAERVAVAYEIATKDVLRATTHNKGIMNGVDATLIATGNDFRAAEAAAHAFASRSGQYRSLSWCKFTGGDFTIGITLPIAVGTVGGITNIHPLARLSLEILGNPSAPELMGVVAAAGLSSNFAAVQSLVTTGIQKGHMKLHLTNIFNILGAEQKQRQEALAFFEGKTVSFSAVKEFLDGGKS